MGNAKQRDFNHDVRTIDDLIGKRVVISDRFFLNEKQKLKRAFFRPIHAIVDSVKTDKNGMIVGIWIRRQNETRIDWDRKCKIVINWRKGRKLITDPDVINPTIHRVRDWTNKWAWECHGSMPDLTRMTMARNQVGSGGVQWRMSGCTIGWFLNNPDLMIQLVSPRQDLEDGGNRRA
jgi:hypothetical protein